MVDRERGEALTGEGARLVPAVDTDDIDRERKVLHEARRLAIVTAPDTVPTGAVAQHLRALATTMPTRGGRARL